MKYFLTLIASLLWLATTQAHASQVVDLDGAWRFKTTLDTDAHNVSVPHSWLLERGYERYVGRALYERDFQLPALAPDRIARLHFDAVYDTTQVWLNGVAIGRHEGGYSEFEFEVTRHLRAGTNHIVVEVDNTPTLTSIPNLATGHPSTDAYAVNGYAKGTIVGWLPYGGIVRPVHLILSDEVYFGAVKIDGAPNLSTGTAALSLQATLKNGGLEPRSVTLHGKIAGLEVKLAPVVVPAGGEQVVRWSAALPKAHLWSVRDPYLYDAKLAVGDVEYSAQIGVRRIEVQGTRLLLNGREVHLNGANRVTEDPEEGLLESDKIVERDMGDMLAANMRMMRIGHYPQPQNLLDFADRHGMLLIAEAGNWGMSSWQMADQEVRQRYRLQMKEMMEQDVSHPSIIAWSLGNEFESYKPEGQAWVREMSAFVKEIDTTRLITFADRYTLDAAVKSGEDDASRYSDFVCVNIYGDYAHWFDHVHELYPDKPVFVSEFGWMEGAELQDPGRIANITDAMNAVKARPWMIGASLWTWNDYRSFIKGTPPDGVRRWGVVTPERKHRESWDVVRKLFATELP